MTTEHVFKPTISSPFEWAVMLEVFSTRLGAYKFEGMDEVPIGIMSQRRISIVGCTWCLEPPERLKVTSAT